VSHAGASGAFEPIHSDTRGSHRKLTPEAHARRGELAKYVKAVVAISAAILVLGLVRMSFFKGHKEEPVLANLGSAVQTAAAPSTAQPAQTQPAQTAVPTDQIPPAPLATAEEKVEPAALVEAGKVEEIKDDKPEVKPTRTAAQEKAAAQAALEGGNAGGAIGAGQRSVALDPTDAEAWLILGGAYQMQNRNGEAKAAFSSCVKQAKRGPVGECTQMLQQ
jgi:predicted Zn-dependent protease